MGGGRAMSSRAMSSRQNNYGQLGYKPADRSLPVPAKKQQFGTPKRDSGANIAAYVPEQRSREEQVTDTRKAKEDEQSAQWSRATSEMKTPNVMYDDRNQTEIAGKYADEAGRAGREAERRERADTRRSLRF